MNPILRKNYGTEAIVPPYRIVKFGAVDLNVVPAAASTDKLIGISGRLGASVSGDRCDVTRAGLEEVEYGGNVAAGDYLTSDASGKAVTAAPGAGVNAYVIGQAEVAGVSGDIGKVFIAPGRIQG